MKKGVISLEKLIELMSVNPRKRFGFAGGYVEDGAPADLAILDLNREWAINSADFISMGKATPFEGWQVSGKVMMTMVEGEIKYEETTA